MDNPGGTPTLLPLNVTVADADAITNVTQPTFDGTSEPGSRVTLFATP